MELPLEPSVVPLAYYVATNIAVTLNDTVCTGDTLIVSMCASVCHRDLGSDDSVTRLSPMGPADRSIVSPSVSLSLSWHSEVCSSVWEGSNLQKEQNNTWW